MKSSSEPKRASAGRPGFVFFDLDDTLLDHTAAERAALGDLARDVLGIDPSSERMESLRHAYHHRNRELWTDYSEGLIDKDRLRRLRFEYIADQFGDGHAWSQLDTFYMDRYARYWRPVDGAMDVFEWVGRHFTVGIITNGFADTQHAKLRRFPALGRVSRTVVISEEVGYLKPDPRLFEFAREAAGEPGHRILYVGDSLRSDVRGALAAGWEAAWYTTDPVPDDLLGRVFAFARWADLREHLRDVPM